VQIVEPDLDLRSRFAHFDQLDQMIKLRKYPIDCDLKKLSDDYNRWWQVFVNYKTSRLQLDRLSKQHNQHDDVERIQSLRKMMGQSRKQLNNMTNIIGKCLALPNDLHTIDDRLFDKNNNNNTESSIDSHRHMNILESMDAIKIADNQVYLIGDGVRLQSKLKRLVEKRIVNELESILTSPPLIVRAAIVDGCNIDLDEYADIIDSESSSDSMRLVGCDLPSMLAPFVKSKLTRVRWPIRLHSIGATYRRRRVDSDLSLYNCSQQYALTMIELSNTESMAEFSFDSTVEVIKSIMDDCRLDRDRYYRVSTADLYWRESSAISWNSDEVIRASQIGTYISRRLRLMHQADDYLFLNHYHIDVTSLIGAIIDNHYQQIDENCSFINIID
jgi:hypothetical protein